MAKTIYHTNNVFDGLEKATIFEVGNTLGTCPPQNRFTNLTDAIKHYEFLTNSHVKAVLSAIITPKKNKNGWETIEIANNNSLFDHQLIRLKSKKTILNELLAMKDENGEDLFQVYEDGFTNESYMWINTKESIILTAQKEKDEFVIYKQVKLSPDAMPEEIYRLFKLGVPKLTMPIEDEWATSLAEVDDLVTERYNTLKNKIKGITNTTELLNYFNSVKSNNCYGYDDCDDGVIYIYEKILGGEVRFTAYTYKNGSFSIPNDGINIFDEDEHCVTENATADGEPFVSMVNIYDAIERDSFQIHDKFVDFVKNYYAKDDDAKAIEIEDKINAYLACMFDNLDSEYIK